jgi:hypothetical protein
MLVEQELITYDKKGDIVLVQNPKKLHGLLMSVLQTKQDRIEYFINIKNKHAYLL